MAIVTEYFRTREDGVELERTYSDSGKYIERNGAKYVEAVDPVGSGRVYTETEEDIPVEETITDGWSEIDAPEEENILETEE